MGRSNYKQRCIFAYNFITILIFLVILSSAMIDVVEGSRPLGTDPDHLINHLSSPLAKRFAFRQAYSGPSHRGAGH
ncbi:hypothetical protein Scep_001040 [Stephania cephalantha]|uniref:Uncharacterized protein n=1 Tax=Stephania cephalantha TaxID=152367 RepID=A0AAP0Q4N9_9MAGN